MLHKILPYLCKATLLDDSGPWNDPALVAQIEAELKAVRSLRAAHRTDGASILKQTSACSWPMLWTGLACLMAARAWLLIIQTLLKHTTVH